MIRDLNQIPDLQPRVLDLRPDEESRSPTAIDPLVRWVVQVGSFGEPTMPRNWSFSLRDAGFRASSQAVNSAGA